MYDSPKQENKKVKVYQLKQNKINLKELRMKWKNSKILVRALWKFIKYLRGLFMK